MHLQMAEAPAVDETLKSDGVSEILDELVEAQNHSKVLGVKLLPPHEVEAIHRQYQDPKERLLHILLAFTSQIQPRPTWRIIVEALRSPSVNLPRLARRVEAAHFPDSTSTRDVVPETTTENYFAANTAVSDDEVKSKPTSQLNLLCPVSDSGHGGVIKIPSSSEEVNKMIMDLEKIFDNLKNTVRKSLEDRGVQVKRAADVLTSLSADEDDNTRMFAESHVSVLFKAADIPELFGTMNFNWNYLSPPPLDHLVKKFDLDEVKPQMEAYKSHLQQFRMKTPLTMFCRTQKRKRLKPTGEFREMVAEFEWPENVTLEVVEQFRQEYASHYNLRECAMMIAQVRPGSFIITWFIPESVVEKLKEEVPRAILKKYSATKLEIAGACVYRSRKPQEKVPVTPSTSIGPASAASVLVTGLALPGAARQPKPLSVEDYLFVEEPSDDFFCPVTTGVLLQPHLTSCCGNHISEEAAARIKGDEGACPLCKKKDWNTMFSKHFQRQVNSLRVFCCHEDRGCGWQGELAAFHRHVKSCSMRDGPPMTELLKLPVYKEARASSPQSSTSGTATPLLNFKSRPWDKAPRTMFYGSATADSYFAYFVPGRSTEVYRYDLITDVWQEFPSCPYVNAGLVVIEGRLTAVGGSAYDGYEDEYTNELCTLNWEKLWVEEYPPMFTARSSPATSVSKYFGTDYLIVIGGKNYNGWTTAVEVLNIGNREWFELTDLPRPLRNPSSTILSVFEFVHVAGYGTSGYSGVIVWPVPSSDQPITSPLSLSWNPLPHLPVTWSKPIFFAGELVIIGGKGIKSSEVTTIHQLRDEQWMEIGSMPHNRKDCLVVHSSPRQVFIVGGRCLHNGLMRSLDLVEECRFTLTPM